MATDRIVAGLVITERVLDAITEQVAARLREDFGDHGDREPSEKSDFIRGAKRAAAYLGCSPQRVYDLANQRRLPFSKDGSVLVFRRDDLTAYLAATREEARSRV